MSDTLTAHSNDREAALEAEAITKVFHFAGFFGCLIASFWKNMLLRSKAVEGHRLGKLIMLDRVSGGSAVVIFLSGLALTFWAAKPTSIYFSLTAYWLKVGLYVAASLAVVFTKPVIRKAANTGQLKPTLFIRLLLVFDLASILTIAAIGRMIARSSVF